MFSLFFIYKLNKILSTERTNSPVLMIVRREFYAVFFLVFKYNAEIKLKKIIYFYIIF